MLASALRGGTRSFLGAPGDIESLGRQGINYFGGNVDPETVMATSDDYHKLLPRVNPQEDPSAPPSTYDKIGESLDVKSLGKKGAAAMAPMLAGALRKGGRTDLTMGHATSLMDLLKRNDRNPSKIELPNELYNTSFGITKDKLIKFGTSDAVLVPKLGAFDPKTSPTVIHAFDGYTPRRSATQGHRVDEVQPELSDYRETKQQLNEGLPEFLQGMEPDFHAVKQRHEALFKALANKRLVDRFGKPFPKGGLMGELANEVPQIPELPKFGSGGLPQGTVATLSEHHSPLRNDSYGHRFHDFGTYEKYGAPRLSSKVDASDTYKEIGDFLYDRVKAGQIPTLHGTEQSDLLRMLAQQTPKTPGYDAGVTREAQRLSKALRNTHADYAELKAFGPVGLHSDNFAGILASPHNSKAWLKAAEKSANERGMQFGTWGKAPGTWQPGTNYDEWRAINDLHETNKFNMASQMQGQHSPQMSELLRQQGRAMPVAGPSNLRLTSEPYSEPAWVKSKAPVWASKNKPPDWKMHHSQLTDEEMAWVLDNDPDGALAQQIENSFTVPDGPGLTGK